MGKAWGLMSSDWMTERVYAAESNKTGKEKEVKRTMNLPESPCFIKNSARDNDSIVKKRVDLGVSNASWQGSQNASGTRKRFENIDNSRPLLSNFFILSILPPFDK
jgi:hypothetical protein